MLKLPRSASIFSGALAGSISAEETDETLRGRRLEVSSYSIPFIPPVFHPSCLFISVFPGILVCAALTL